MQEEREVELLYSGVKGLQPFRIDMRIAPDAAGRFTPTNPSLLTASSSTSSAIPVSVKGTAAVAQTRPG
jgi:hypothetical protein